MTKKQQLLQEIRELGFDEKHVDWLERRYTATRLQTVIDNVRTYRTITSMAKEAGLERKN